MVIAIVHVLGALVSSFAFGILVLWIGAWEQERVQKRRMQDAAMALGVPVSAFEHDESLIPRLIQYSSARFSGELLRNRLSDLCGAVRTTWGWLSSVLQVVIVVGVGWSMYTEGAQNAVVMWAVLAVAIFFWLASVALSFACLLVTGRYPGEAKMARKALAAFIEERDAAAAHDAPNPLAAAWET